MSGRKRNVYANRRSANGTGYMRGALTVLALVVLSFGLGFFVLARLLPGDASPQSKANATAKKTETSEPAPPVIAEKPVIPAPSPSRVVVPVPKDDGPLIEPQDETATQTPTSPDDSKPVENNLNRTKKRRGNVPPPDTSGAADPIQTPKQPDALNPAATAETPSVTRKRFHVQINLHETREAAEQEAQQIVDRGFTAHVRPVLREGRKLYRVELDVLYKHKQNANAALQRLQEAGIASAIVTER